MKKISLIQVGDIHFPDASKSPQMADKKDGGISDDWVTNFSPNKLKKVSGAIYNLLQSDTSVRGVLLSGDLTSKSDLEGYENCLAYLSDALNFADKEF